MAPAHMAARVLAAARDQMRCDWLLVGSDTRLRAGVLSWLRGRQHSMTQQFQQRWCHGDVLCSLPEDMEEPTPHSLDSGAPSAAAGLTPQAQPARAQNVEFSAVRL